MPIAEASTAAAGGTGVLGSDIVAALDVIGAEYCPAGAGSGRAFSWRGAIVVVDFVVVDVVVVDFGAAFSGPFAARGAALAPITSS
jgi:hypothetical protein